VVRMEKGYVRRVYVIYVMERDSVLRGEGS
jgi:hypothetical protein